MQSCKTENYTTLVSERHEATPASGPFVHVLTASSVCQPEVMFMKTELGMSSTLQWERHGARGAWGPGGGGGVEPVQFLQRCPQFVLRLQPAIVPVVAKVCLVEDIRAKSGTCNPLENFALLRYTQKACMQLKNETFFKNLSNLIGNSLIDCHTGVNQPRVNLNAG